MCLYEFDAVGQYVRTTRFRTAELLPNVQEEKISPYSLVQCSTSFTKLNFVPKKIANRRSQKVAAMSSTGAKIANPRMIISLPKGARFHAKRSYIVSIPWSLLLPHLSVQTDLEISPEKLFSKHFIVTRKRNSMYFCEAPRCLKDVANPACLSCHVPESKMHHSSLILQFHEKPLNSALRCVTLEKFIDAEKSNIHQLASNFKNYPLDKRKHKNLLDWKLLKKLESVSLDSDSPSVDSPSHSPSNTGKHFHAVYSSDADSHATPSKDDTEGFYIPRLKIADIPRFRAASTSRRSNTTELLSRYEPLISCVIPDALYVGGEKPCKDPEYLRSAGITTIINLSPESSVYTPPADMNYHEFDMRDNPKFDISQYLEQILQIIDGAESDRQFSELLVPGNECRSPSLTHMSDRSVEKRRNVVYLHCQRGISRSVTMAIAYTVRKFGLSVDKCLSMIKGDSVSYGSGCSSSSLDGAHTNRNPIDAPSDELLTLAGGSYKIASTRPIAQPNAGFTVQLYNLEKRKGKAAVQLK